MKDEKQQDLRDSLTFPINRSYAIQNCKPLPSLHSKVIPLSQTTLTFDPIEKVADKRENIGYQHFFCQQCFQMASCSGPKEPRHFDKGVNPLPRNDGF